MKYRKGELAFYKSSLPKELKKYSGKFSENKEYLDLFLKEYEYNYVEKKWVKKAAHNTLMDRLRGED